MPVARLIGTRLAEDVIRELDTLAAADDRSRSNMLAKIIREYVTTQTFATNNPETVSR